jgi:hypothetical protein
LVTTIASLPITALTTPLDAIKTQKQALMRPKGESMIKTLKYIVENYGVFALG